MEFATFTIAVRFCNRLQRNVEVNDNLQFSFLEERLEWQFDSIQCIGYKPHFIFVQNMEMLKEYGIFPSAGNKSHCYKYMRRDQGQESEQLGCSTISGYVLHLVLTKCPPFKQIVEFLFMIVQLSCSLMPCRALFLGSGIEKK